MKRFRTFIIEDGAEIRARQRERQALKDKGYNIGTSNDPISNYVKDVAGGIAADPLEFAKQYGKSLVTDPETYHSGLAAAGMVPGIGEIADVADAALYKAQGDDEMTKLSLASGIPLAGAIGNLSRIGRSAGKFGDDLAASVAKTDLSSSGSSLVRLDEPKPYDLIDDVTEIDGELVSASKRIPKKYTAPTLGATIRSAWNDDPKINFSPLDNAPTLKVDDYTSNSDYIIGTEGPKSYLFRDAEVQRFKNKDNPSYWENIVKNIKF